jgi:hypothetical protein
MNQNATPLSEETELDLEIAQLEREIADLKQRHEDVQLAEREQVVLQRQRNEFIRKFAKNLEQLSRDWIS